MARRGLGGVENTSPVFCDEVHESGSLLKVGEHTWMTFLFIVVEARCWNLPRIRDYGRAISNIHKD